MGGGVTGWQGGRKNDSPPSCHRERSEQLPCHHERSEYSPHHHERSEYSPITVSAANNHHPLRFHVLLLPNVGWAELKTRVLWLEELGLEIAALADHVVDWTHPA